MIQIWVRRLTPVVLLLLFVVGLVWAWRAYSEQAEVDRVRQLARAMRESPEPEREATREEFREAMGDLSEEQRRALFEQREEERLDDYFSLSEEKRKEFIDRMIQRGEEMAGRRRERRAQADPGGDGLGPAGNADGGPQRGGPGGHERFRNMSPEQREEFRRQRLDNTSAEQRGRRNEFRRDMQQRREELGLPPRGPGGRFDF